MTLEISFICPFIFFLPCRYLGQPLDGLNNLGPSASARNVALGCASSSSPLTAPLDLMEVDLANGERLVSFLGVTLGVIADGDIGTEVGGRSFRQ